MVQPVGHGGGHAPAGEPPRRRAPCWHRVYDPDTDDDVVRAELAAEAEAAAEREAVLREAQRIAARAYELKALRELVTLKDGRLYEALRGGRFVLITGGAYEDPGNRLQGPEHRDRPADNVTSCNQAGDCALRQELSRPSDVSLPD
ncbi:hypothetical protein ACIQU3_21320 [Streptomyces sp. NPDC101110]|uniref:hypothetical protein n=1 Tax=Streptomyces sp. NPDC101110 TaxID=3366104 RepID=UPI0038204562